jgi:hypothetical protein
MLKNIIVLRVSMALNFSLKDQGSNLDVDLIIFVVGDETKCA